MCSVIVKLCISQEKSINRLGQLVRGLRGEAQGKNKNHLLLVVATIGRELMATFEGDWWQQLHFYELFSSCICIFVTVKSEESKWVYKNTRFKKKQKKKTGFIFKKMFVFCAGFDWFWFGLSDFQRLSWKFLYHHTSMTGPSIHFFFFPSCVCVGVYVSCLQPIRSFIFFLLLPIGHLGKGFVHSAVVQ